MYNKTQKQKILTFLKTHTQAETCRTFGVRPDTLKYWQNAQYKDMVKQRESNKYQSAQPTKRSYTRGNAEAQRLNAQISRAIKRVPEIHCDPKDIERELKNLENKEGSLDAVACANNTILTYQQHFYEKERELFSDPKIARRLIKNRQKYLFKEPKDLTDREILRGFKISGEFYGFSHFAPQWFKWFIEKTNSKSVLDPCGGWGHRMLGTIGTNLENYIYNDFDKRTYEGCAQIYQDWKHLFKTQANFFNERAEHLEVINLKYDSIFTCPPYFNKEKYNNTEFNDYEDFKQWWQRVIFNIVKKEVLNIGIVIDAENVEAISLPIISSGFELKERVAIKPKKSHFTNGSEKDIMLIFSRAC